MIRTITCAVASFALFTQNGQGQNKNSEPERFMDGITATLKWFTGLQEYYQQYQVEPAARDQSVRYLTKLSNSFSDLEIDKQDFTEALRTANFPKDANALQRRAETLRSTVWELRRRLHDYVAILPPRFQSSADQLETILSKGLADKCASLSVISIQLTGKPDIDRDQLVAMGEKTIEAIQQLRSNVSGLITKLATQTVK